MRSIGCTVLQKSCDALKTHNIPHEVLNAKEVMARFPALKVDDNCAAILEPQGGVLRADKAVRAFQTMFKLFGGTIKDDCPATSIQPGELVKVITEKGIYSAKNLVIAAGAWAGKFTTALGLNVPLKPIKIMVYYWKTQDDKIEIHRPPSLPCFFRSSSDAGFRLYGSPDDEYPGLVKVALHDGPPVDPDHRDDADATWIMPALRSIMDIFPWLSEKPSFHETCMYTMTPDAHPCIDIHPRYSNIVIAAGFSGHGFKLAPAVGNAVSELIIGTPPSYNMNPFKLDRFNSKASL